MPISKDHAGKVVIALLGLILSVAGTALWKLFDLHAQVAVQATEIAHLRMQVNLVSNDVQATKSNVNDIRDWARLVAPKAEP